jgi:Fe-S cluster assembly protein SufD
MSIQVSMIPDLGVATTASEKRSAWWKALVQQYPFFSDAPDWMQALRERAAAEAEALPLPTTRDEEWRFTDLSKLVATSFRNADVAFPAAHGVETLYLPEAPNRLVFSNGLYCHGLSEYAESSGMFVGELRRALEIKPVAEALQTHWGQISGWASQLDAFTLLNTASFDNVVVIWVGKNQQIEAPLQILSVDWDGDTPVVFHPRCLVIAEANSSLTLVCNSVTEIWLGENAQVNHSRVQHQNHQVFHIGKTAVSQARSSRYTCNAISLGAQLSRHNLDIYQGGEQTETTLNGLTMIGGEQVGDLHSAIALNYPHGTTRQLQKNIVNDKAHAIFNGKVFVPKAAQLTDAGQLNRNLLLSPKARVDTKPQLEIVADNVKCTHGATVSQLEDDEVFYLQSRGIDAVSAQQLLVYAFAFEVINTIPVPSLQQRLAQQVKPQD